MRFLFYSHDGVGLGHVRRHLAIAAALAELSPRAKVLLATSVDEVSRLGLPPHVDTLKIPALQKVTNSRYTSRRLGLTISQTRALRSGLLRSAVESFRPLLVLVDKHPLGAAGEFEPGLIAAKEIGSKVVLGLRDILDDTQAVQSEWRPAMMRRVVRYYDRILVYGEPSVYNPAEQYQFTRALVGRTAFCGYVVNQFPCASQSKEFGPALLGKSKHPIVLATAGGGEDGFVLLQTFMKASKGAPWTGIAVAGPLLAQSEWNALQILADQTGVRLIRFVPCLARLFHEVDTLVCMGGYNTLLEAISTGLPALCVPRAQPRSEQLLRAEAFERLGLLRTIHPRQLTVKKLRQGIAAGLRLKRRDLQERARSVLHFDGAPRAAQQLLALCNGHPLVSTNGANAGN
jgi:predicted glycosyltransferase